MAGSVSCLGEAYSNINDAKILIIKWQELYHYSILSHDPAENLFVAVSDALAHRLPTM